MSQGKTTFSALTAAHYNLMLDANFCEFQGKLEYENEKLLAVCKKLKKSFFEQLDINLEVTAIQVKPNPKVLLISIV